MIEHDMDNFELVHLGSWVQQDGGYPGNGVHTPWYGFVIRTCHTGLLPTSRSHHDSCWWCQAGAARYLFGASLTSWGSVVSKIISVLLHLITDQCLTLPQSTLNELKENGHYSGWCSHLTSSLPHRASSSRSVEVILSPSGMSRTETFDTTHCG